jgi:phenylalanyl-tRNA synthetase beta chain
MSFWEGVDVPGDALRLVILDKIPFAVPTDPVTVARTARRHKLPSEASRRFERGVDPTLGPIAAQRVVDLLVSLAGGTADPLGSDYSAYPEPESIDFDPAKPAAVIGVGYTEAEVRDSLVMIGAKVEMAADAGGDSHWTVTPPSWRPDLTDPLTLVEEVARIVGYDRIPSVLPIAPPGRGLTRAQSARRRAAATLAAAGATEVLAYPFSSAAMVALFDPDAPAIQLANPLDPQTGLLRRSLLPGLIEIARRNLSRGLTDLALFEIGTVFLPEAGVVYGTDFIPVGDARPDEATLEKLNASIPPQSWHVGGLFLGEALPKQPGAVTVPTGLSDALDVVRQLSVALAVEVTIATGSHVALHPGRTASLSVGGRVVGVAGELLPSLAHKLDLPRTVALVELDLDALIELGALQAAPTQLGTLPAATQDLSLVVPIAAPAGEVLAAVIAGAGPLLEDARLIDDYRGTGLPDGRKSLTFALRFRAPDRTLTAAEASEAKLAGASRAGELFGATVRE